MIFGFLITFFSSTIAIVGIILNLTGKENDRLAILIFTFLILFGSVFLGLKIIKIGRLKLVSMENFSENISKTVEMSSTVGNISENLYTAVEMPLIKRLFWILTIAVGGLIVLSIVYFTLISMYILITDEQARYVINISNGFNFTFVFLSSTFIGFYLMSIGKMHLTAQGSADTIVRQNSKNKAILKYLISLLGMLLGLMAILWSVGTSLFFIGAGGTFSLDARGLEATLLYLGIILGGVGGGVLCIIKSVRMLKNTTVDASAKPEVTTPSN